MKYVGVALLIIMTALGAFLVAGYGRDDRGLSRRQRQLELIQSQLADLGDHLRDYRKAHGHYPTNDEGLAALDNFESRFKTTLYRSQGQGPEYGFADQFPSYFWELMQLDLAEYRKKNGHAPRSVKDLADTRIGVMGFLDPPFKDDLTPVEVELVITRSDNLFQVSSAGVLSPWGLPYVYENRNGLDPGKFASSPANTDDKRRWSVRVDEGVYASSVCGQLVAEEYDKAWWQWNRPRMLGLWLLGGSLLLIVLLFVAKAGKVGLLVAALAGVAGLAPNTIRRSCYEMGLMSFWRSKEMVARQAALLDKFHASGLINDATYAAARSALEPPAATQPGSAPAGTNGD